VVRFLGVGGLRVDLSADLRDLNRRDAPAAPPPAVAAASALPAAVRRFGHQGLRTKAYVAGRLGSASRGQQSGLSGSEAAGRRSPCASLRGHKGLRALTLVVKQLLADHGLGDKASGGLSGYGCFLVVDCFLVWHARTVRQLRRGQQPGWLGDDDGGDGASDSDGESDDGSGEAACSLGWLLLAFLEQHASLVDCRRLAFTPRGYARRTDGDPSGAPPHAMVVTDPAAAVGDARSGAGNVARGLYRLSHLQGVLALAWQSLGRGDGLAAVLTTRPVPKRRNAQPQAWHSAAARAAV
jgi:hypothetical protein